MNKNPEPNPEATPAPKGKKKAAVTTYKTSLLNPAWADEVVKAHGLTGPLAKAIAADLAKQAAKYLSKSLNDDKITKMIRTSFGVHVGTVTPE